MNDRNRETRGAKELQGNAGGDADNAATGGVRPSEDIPPFRESGSGDSYSPSGNWGAERQSGTTPEGVVERALGASATEGLGSTGAAGAGAGAAGSGMTMAGSPTDAGDGGFGPEGGYTADNETGSGRAVGGEAGGAGTSGVERERP